MIHVFTMFRLETVRNELILQGLNYLSGAFLSSPKRGAVRSAERLFPACGSMVVCAAQDCTDSVLRAVFMGGTIPWLLRGRCEELTEESFAVRGEAAP